MSISWQLDVDPAPALLVLPPAAASLDEAHAAIELWEHYSGKTLDSTQRLVVEVMMAQASDGRWAASTTGREMPRQNGKGDEIEVVELWGLVQRSEAILHTVHEAALLATQAQQRMLAVLDHPDLRRLTKRVHKGIGQQMIEMTNGGCIWYRTRTGGGGRGVDDVDRLVIDEAQHATEEHLGAVSPTLLANANPQMNAMGTSGLSGKSEWWWLVRKRAISANPGAFGYVGHTAEHVYLKDDGSVVQEPVDVENRDLWYACNPVLKAGRGSGLPYFEEQLLRLGPELFAQEHLGVWNPPPGATAEPKLPQGAWRASVIRRSQVPEPAPGAVSLAFDVALDSTHASVAIGVGTITAPYVELVEHRSGVGWLPELLVGLAERWKPLAIGYNDAGATRGQVSAVLVALRNAGIDTDLLTPVGAGAYQGACGGFYADVAEGRLTRPPDQAALDIAGETAAERPLGDGWVWNVRKSTAPISPLVAATVARALLPTEVKPAVTFAVF